MTRGPCCPAPEEDEIFRLRKGGVLAMAGRPLERLIATRASTVLVPQHCLRCVGRTGDLGFPMIGGRLAAPQGPP